CFVKEESHVAHAKKADVRHEFLALVLLRARNDGKANDDEGGLFAFLALLLLWVRFSWKLPKMQNSRERFLAALASEPPISSTPGKKTYCQP
ncbi:MAG TPA: hypothetical protein VFA15_04925, partial [Nitrososphaera sp.]|nr:hypothetical protein [Nitrososphaera sp.]